eukprot:CAMPEP_0206454524 /NCGR_PEP_ID=MMETSP0324_2-20121206/21187_1 /ASSEMBLY_ACC=CAM_ASM_000836 /TAXON_ID=2866 /ORGANISM="Crypthecodinium cohnii, Strain Seligo" /LENGTH=452 /DNA_ID=CAMNT_0053925011 /DNA_START=163 /DNA_END=1521 /DNA_ORIENTATION=+
MATEWTVLVFGDSWAQYMHPCWPEVLGSEKLSSRVLNFANAGSLCSDLHMQAQQALMHPQVPKVGGGMLKKETLVVVHTCGNDFIQKMLGAVFGGAGVPEVFRPNPGTREAAMITSFMELMYRAGARNFLISGVPAFPEMPIWSMLWPFLTTLVNQGKLVELGVSPQDDPRLALDVQITALHDRWEGLCADFQRSHDDTKCVFFDEVGILEKLRNKIGSGIFDRQMWDFSMFHPTYWGHQQIAGEAHRIVASNIPQLAALVPHPEAQTPAAAANTSNTNANNSNSNSSTVAASTVGGGTSVITGASSDGTSSTAAPSPAAAAGEAVWTCNDCTLDNDPARTICEACEAPRPKGDSAPQPAVSSNPITVKVRNVKGDTSFSVDIDGNSTVAALKAALLANAPASFAPPGSKIVIALGGKFLSKDDDRLVDVQIQNNTQVIAVPRPATASAAKA